MTIGSYDHGLLQMVTIVLVLLIYTPVYVICICTTAISYTSNAWETDMLGI